MAATPTGENMIAKRFLLIWMMWAIVVGGERGEEGEEGNGWMNRGGIRREATRVACGKFSIDKVGISAPMVRWVRETMVLGRMVLVG